MIALVPFSQLDQTTVDQAYAEVLQAVQEDNPLLDLRKAGPFAALLIRYNSILGAQRETNIADYLQANSLAAIDANPALADEDLVDAVLSNFRVVRRQGVQATGEVTVIVSTDTTVTIAQGSIWTVGTIQFFAPQVYMGKTESSQVNDPGDRVLTPTADGNWAFTITLTAVAVGVVSVPKDTLVAPQIVPDNYVNSIAASDFTGGSNTETNADLIARFQEGLAAQALSNRINMRAMLQAQPAFANVISQSIIGMGDAEMSRDRHTIFPVSSGGRVDWYVRTQETIFRQALTLTATLISITDASDGVWQITLDRSTAAGLYLIANIRVVGDVSSLGGFSIVSVVRTLDLSGEDFVPDIATQAEGTYSRFHAVTVQFIDNVTSYATLAVGATALYNLEARGMPLIADIQDFVSGRSVRSFGADCLVKAPIPCIVQLSLTVYKSSGDADPVVSDIATALAHTVNTVGFVGQLFASQLQETIYPFLAPDQRVSAIDMLGLILTPAADPYHLHDSEVLTVPEDPTNFVTARTVQFFLDPSDVAITIVTSVPTQV